MRGEGSRGVRRSVPTWPAREERLHRPSGRGYCGPGIRTPTTSSRARRAAITPGRKALGQDSHLEGSAEPLLLGGLVGDLQEVGDRQSGEGGSDEAGEARCEEEAQRESSHDPKTEAVGTD